MENDNREDFTEDPVGLAKRWTTEFDAAKKAVEAFHLQGKQVFDAFRLEHQREGSKKWSLFTTNVQLTRSLLYGKTPSVDVARTFGDANDDVARVAAEMLERCLNNDISRDTDTYAVALEHSLDDRLLPGLGIARDRYEAHIEEETVEAKMSEDGQVLAEGFTRKVKKSEDVHVDYYHWDDVLWSAGSRIFEEHRWWAFRAQMNRRQLKKRFNRPVGEGDKVLGDLVPLNSKANAKIEGEAVSPWQRADVWEIWSKEDKKVYWFVEGFEQVLDVKDDPYQLEGFWPFERPMLANVTTNTPIPRSDFELYRACYEELDEINGRISKLMQSLRVVGVYDKSMGQLEDLLKRNENEMVPVDNWAMFAKRGGISGAVDWFPIQQVVETILQLRDYRTELIQTLQQLTGLGDIMRGQASVSGVTATEQSIKARFGSARIQAMQDEFARFASGLQRIKAELMARFFEPETFIARSNMMNSGESQQLVMQAIELIKSDIGHFRIQVKPESINLTDYAALKAERTEWMAAMSGFFQACAPIAQAMPGAMPFLLELGQWSMAGLKGGSTAEGIFDRAIQAAKKAAEQQAQNPQAQQVDPKIQAAQIKIQGDAQRAQMDMQKEQLKQQGELQRIQAETVAKDEQERSQARWNVAEAIGKHSVTPPKPLNLGGNKGGIA